MRELQKEELSGGTLDVKNVGDHSYKVGQTVELVTPGLVQSPPATPPTYLITVTSDGGEIDR